MNRPKHFSELTGAGHNQRPAPTEALARAQTALEGFQFTERTRDLTANEFYENFGIPDDSDMDDLVTEDRSIVTIDTPDSKTVGWTDEKVIGKEWEADEPNSGVQIQVYDKEVRRKLGELFAERHATIALFHLHGQLKFQRKVEDAEFSGIIYFLGDGDVLEEIQIFSEYIHGTSADTQHELYEFSKLIGLTGLVTEAQGLRELPNIEHRIVAPRGLAENISEALENLQTAATPGT